MREREKSYYFPTFSKEKSTVFFFPKFPSGRGKAIFLSFFRETAFRPSVYGSVHWAINLKPLSSPFSPFSLSLLYTGWRSKPLLLVPLCVFAVCVPRLRFIGGKRRRELFIGSHTHRVGKKKLLKHTRDLNSPKKFPCKKRTHCI